MAETTALDRPLRLRPGDRVAVVAPSGPVSPERLPYGCARLRAPGLDVFNLDGVKPDDFFWHAAVTAAASFAQETYDPRPYAGPALVFQTKRALSGEASDWSPVAPNARTLVLDVTDGLEIMKTPEFIATVNPR